MKIPGRVAIGVRSEATQGTPVVPAATDFFHAVGVEIDVDAELLQRDLQRVSFDTIAHVVGKRNCKVKFKTELKSNGIVGGTLGSGGTSYVPLGSLLKACCFSETVSAGVSITYAPITTAVSQMLGNATACTFEIYKDGIKHIVAGCVGSWKISLEVNKIPMIEFDFSGIYAAFTDAAFPSQTLAAQAPVAWQNSTATIHTYAANIKKWEIDAGNVVTPVDSSLATFNGLAGFQCTGRNPQGNIEFETVAIATHNPVAVFIAGTSAVCACTIGAVAGNIISISSPKVQYTGAKYGEAGGGVSSQVPVVFRGNTGDDWISIVLT
jgi:hypothetical protein